MNFSGITDEIVQALSLAPERGLLDTMFAAVRPEIAEWSVNEDGDTRGRLRVALRPSDPTRVRDALARLSHPFALALCDELAGGIREAFLGVALSASDNSLRFWAAPRPAQRQAFIDIATRAEPSLAEPARMLADRCGGMDAYQGLGVEGRGKRTSRWTLYFSIPERSTAERLLEHTGRASTRRRDFFIRTLLGIEARHPRPFPRVWIGRSMGLSSGWKFYYFARGDHSRLPDGVLLDLMDASPALRETWRILGSHARSSMRPDELIHIIGMTIPDGASEPRLTVYFALDSWSDRSP